jgi:hypothetical protein
MNVQKLPSLVTAIALIVSGIVWATTVSVKANNSAERLDKLELYVVKENDRKQIFEREVIERLARIEQALKETP